jgi:hypothetical protein
MKNTLRFNHEGSESGNGLDRRSFLKVALGGVIGGLIAANTTACRDVIVNEVCKCKEGCEGCSNSRLEGCSSRHALRYSRAEGCSRLHEGCAQMRTRYYIRGDRGDRCEGC